MLKLIIMWVLFIPVPIINGALREFWYKKKTSELITNIIGIVVLSFVFLGYVYLFFKDQLLNIDTAQALYYGLLWLGLTLCFEFGIGLASGKSWNLMFEDYKIHKGRLWPVFLLVVLFSIFIIKLIAL